MSESEIVRIIADCFESGGKLLVIGNGGSLSQADHIACEFIGDGFPSIALTNPSIITAIGNDYGFNEVFSHQIKALAKKGDVVLALSTSGMSKNILYGVRIAKSIGCTTIAITISSLLSKLVDASIELSDSAGDTQGIQEETIKTLHRIWLAVVVKVRGGE